MTTCALAVIGDLVNLLVAKHGLRLASVDCLSAAECLSLCMVLNRRTVNDGDVVENPPEPSANLSVIKNGLSERRLRNAEIIMMRTRLYMHEVLRGSKVEYGTVMRLLVLRVCLKQRKLLYTSISELIEGEEYAMYAQRSPALFSLFDEQARRGILIKTTRAPVRGGVRPVVIWGLSKRGHQFLDLYCEYMDGEHDERFASVRGLPME